MLQNAGGFAKLGIKGIEEFQRIVTMASEKDLKHPEIGKVLGKYLKGNANVTCEDRAHHATGGEPDLGHGGRRLPDGIDAWCGIASGAADHDRPSGQSGAEEEVG